MYRPTYPPDALRWALGSEPLRVVDLGAGTGLLTRVLLGLGHEVTPVEPDDEMRGQWSARGDLMKPQAGSAEAIPLPDASVDAVVAGQAYHWFDRTKAHPEIARVLRPGGVFAPLWNIRDESVAWVAELSRMADDIGRRGSAHPAEMSDIEFGPLFGRTQREVFRHAVTMTGAALIAMMRTRSYYLTATAVKQAQIETALHDLTAGLPATFALPYLTVTYRTRREPSV